MHYNFHTIQQKHKLSFDITRHIEFKMIDVRMQGTYLQILGNCKKGGT